MSAKWRAQQHRHRFTYSALIFPPHFTDALNQTPSDADSSFSSHFHTQLKELVSLNSIYAQVNHAKNVASAFESLLKNGDEGSVSVAARFYLEILFLENSLQLHRTLVSVLAKVKNFKSVIGNCFQKLCGDYSGVNGKGKRFCVSRVALSMMSSPKLGYLMEIVEECAIKVVLDIVVGLEGVVSETKNCSRPSPVVMEQCQEALSCMYYLLQRFPAKFGDLNSQLSSLVFEDSHILKMIVTTIFSILKSTAFSRDCFVAAGVSFCAALQACLGPEELGLFIMEGVFHRKVVGLSSKFEDLISRVPYKGNLLLEIKELPALNRLSLIRGILTAVPRTVLNTRFVVSKDTSNGFNAHGDRGSLLQTIIYDGVLPELCNYCENPTDGHFNFHALTVVQICLQQIKTLIQTSPSDITEDYDMISEDMVTRILRIIWNNLEDSLSQTVKQVHLIFDLLLDIQSALFWGESSERIKFFLQKIATDLLNMGSRCKGRYVPLASLTKRLGAKSLLNICPDLLFETTQAYIDDDVCCAATTFLKCFLECLRDEWWSTDGIEGGYIKYRSQCLPPFLYGLASGFSKLRSNLNTYALPALLNVDVDSIFPMLAFIPVGKGEEETNMVYPELNCADVTLKVEQQVAVLVSLLKVSRMLALIEGDIDWCSDCSSTLEVIGIKTQSLDSHAFVCIKGIKVKVLVRWLVLALTHADDYLRIDAAETLFLNPKTSSLPSSLELTLLKETVPLNMRCCSTAFQMKWTSLFRKFFSRVRTALERQIKLGIWRPLTSIGENDVSLCKGTDRAEDLYHVMKWLSCFLFSSCYPSAPYERKVMAMELMLIMVNVWSIVPPSHGNFDPDNSQISIYPYSRGFILPDSTMLMVGSIVDSWDRLRERAFHILLQFPSPLPGISSPDMVREAIVWAKKLVCSPRVRESDAGALTLRLVFRKYVLDLGWTVQTLCNIVSIQQKPKTTNGDYQNRSSHSPAIEYIKSLIDWLSAIVEEAEKDLPEACRRRFVHGVLLTLHYTFEELDWNSDMVLCGISEMKHALEKLLDLVMRITSLALWVVSADAWYLSEDMDDMVDDDAFSMEDPIEDVSVPGPDNEKSNSKHVQDMRSSEQIVMVGCWLAMKEVSLLLGTIIRKIPLPASDMPKFGDTLCNTSDVILDLQQLETIGNHFLEVLLKMKHNGAIDKTRAGFAALCNRLLCSNDPRLCKLTESWMEQLMQRTVAKGQTVDDLLRRSAGIPAAFTAFFLSEPEGTPKKLLPRALRWLIDVASQSLIDQTESSLSDNIYNDEFSKKCNQASVSTLSNQMDKNERISKMRDEGVIPTVHAFNVLRAAFNDTNLAVDTSGFSAEALIVSIRSFSSTYWEVRNSACLAYTALVRRMLGFFNVQKRESARRALTGLEFFHRYPSLHTFLYNELKVATDLLGHGSSEHLISNLADVVHPSLCPMLILLSRLKPSTVTSETGDALDPFLFLPFIKRCSTQSNLRVRVLASRALTGLVSSGKLPNVLLNIALELPSRDSYLSLNTDTSNSIDITNGAQCASFNSMHGVLLLLNSLVDGNCRNLADIYRKDQILVELIQVLMRCSWIGRPQLCPCPILNGCFLKVLDNMLGIARTCQMSKSIGAIWNLVWELTWECIEVQSSCGPSYYDPTVAELRRQAAYSYFNCFFQTSKDSDGEEFQIPWRFCLPTSDCSELSEEEIDFPRFQERLVLCMLHESYEVRLATFKWLLQFLKATESGVENCSQSYNVISLIRWTKSNLQEMLMKLLTLETNRRCRYYILRLIFSWNLLQFQKVNNQEPAETLYIGVMNSDLVLQFWDKLVSLYKLTRHAKSRETLIRCMGICVKRMADLLLTSFFPDLEKEENVKFSPSDQSERLPSCLYDCISYYSKLIEQHSESSEPLNMRKAAAESMVASNLLEQAEAVGSSVFNVPTASENPCSSPIKRGEAVNMYAHKVLHMWFICIKLLEDEDVGLRRKLAMDVQKCFHSQRSGKNFQIGANSIQVEKVIELSFEHLSSIFGHWMYYFEFLCRWVSSAANSVISRGDLVRRVFDKEIDNHHEEKLLISQICCYQLEKLPISTSWAMGFPDGHGDRTSLDNWRKRFFQQLISFANDHIDKQGVDWIGGVGNHKDAFLPLYANLLGFFTLSKCIFNGDPASGRSLVSELNELGKTINPFLRNPLIYNLYLLVVKFYEKMIGVPVDNSIYKPPGEGCLWENFDAYFLLR